MRRYISLLYLSYLRYFARKALAKHKPTIIGIAGSVGKSSTAHALFSVLKLHGPTKLIGNSETGIPLGILGLTPSTYSLVDWAKLLIKAPHGIDHLKGTKYLIAEMGIDDPYPPKNMEYLLTIIKPDIAIVLNESATHSEQFEKALPPRHSGKRSASRIVYPERSRRDSGVANAPQNDEERLVELVKLIAEEDCKIITQSGCKIGIYNADDESINAVIASAESTKQSHIHASSETRSNNETIKQFSNDTQLLSFGQDKSNSVSYKTYGINTSSTSFSFTLTMQQSNHATISLSFPGLLLPKEYEQTFASVIAAASSLEVPKEMIIKGLQSFSLPKGRSSLLTGINNSKIIDSSYNASKSAVFAFLDMVKKLKKQTKRPVVFLFGDMRELGEEAKIEHEQVAQKLIGIVDYLYLVGPLTREFVLPLVDPYSSSEYRSSRSNNETMKQSNNGLKEVRWFLNAKYAGEYLKDHIPANALILVKGSQNTIFLEEAIKYILADKEDTKKLTRQSTFWLDLKRKQKILA